jgi:hypothetical protein
VLTLILLLVLLAVAAGCWMQGLWGGLLTLINLLLSGMIAINYFEPVAGLLDKANKAQTHLWDSIALWGLMLISFIVLRLLTEVLSRHRVRFNLWVEMVGRTIVALWIGWLFVGFTLLTMHTAPVGQHPLGFQKEPLSRNFMGFAPDRQWLALVHSRSSGALARITPREFDRDSEFIFKYHQRRSDLAP